MNSLGREILMIGLLGWLLSQPVLATESTQEFVVGISPLAYYLFDEEDSVRESFFISGGTTMFTLFTEWYPLGRFGVGYHHLNGWVKETFPLLTPSSYEYQIIMNLVGAQYVLLMEEDNYARLNLYGAVGPARYTYAVDDVEQGRTTGLARTVGVYYDWGGEGIGGRLGHGVLKAAMPSMRVAGVPRSTSVDGRYTYLSIRVAF